VPPDGLDEISTRMSQCLNRLAGDLEAVTAMSAKAKARAAGWKWSQLASDWVGCYSTLARTP
jgi:hypothetical protein